MSSSSTSSPPSLCDFALPIFHNGLHSLTHILESAKSFAPTQGLNPDEAYVQARLIDDQLPLVFQIQNAVKTVMINLNRLTGKELPLDLNQGNNEKTFGDMIHLVRLATLEVRSVMENQPEEKKDSEIINLLAGGRPIRLTVSEAVRLHGIPNFIFHITTAYSILRAKGVPLGKADFISGFVGW
ncbi:helix-turn-helix-domain-containing protein type [Apiosordaria backusii]|uniref:Helix-turn-helix-domain-containing protein type n=1 Tax=Apiosordaria backusii TaxID=314023 RepID=A0AA40BN97_9PEZI|nr:helix-turn-helix-domain-containing protein type [Apiosordaria backusii]